VNAGKAISRIPLSSLFYFLEISRNCLESGCYYPENFNNGISIRHNTICNSGLVKECEFINGGHTVK